jgi:hypothetical protein
MKSIKLKLLVIAFGFLGISLNSNAQNVGINSTGAAPDASASLDVVATDKGVLIPRVSISNALTAAPVTSPTTSLLVYNTNASITSGNGTGYYYWNGTQWVKLSSDGDDWMITGNAGTTAGTNFIGTTDAVDWVIKTNNTERGRVYSTSEVLFQGTFASGGTINPGAGTRMFWSPKKASFMAGNVSNTQWNDGNVGDYSAIFGHDNIAAGDYNLISGEDNTITSAGSHNIIGGTDNSARGDYNIIGGQNNDVHASAAGDVSNNMVNGLNNDYGTYSIINGFTNQSTNSYATINGQSNILSGTNGTAFGASNTISGDYSIAVGAFSTITSDYSGAFGGTFGNTITINGNYSFGFGGGLNITSTGGYNFALGQTNTISGTGTHNYVLGHSNTNTGLYSLTSGFGNTNGGTFATILGTFNSAGTGAYNMLIGAFLDAPGTLSGQYFFGSGASAAAKMGHPNNYVVGFGNRHNKASLVVYSPSSGLYNYVGVGLDVPQAAMHVRSSDPKTSTTIANTFTVEDLSTVDGTTSPVRAAQIISSATTSASARTRIGLNVDGTAVFGGSLNGNIGINVDVAGAGTMFNYAALFNGGNVGIGTTTPARALHVSDVMRLEPRASAPGSASAGDIYFSSTTNKLMVYDGTTWQACW